MNWEWRVRVGLSCWMWERQSWVRERRRGREWEA